MRTRELSSLPIRDMTNLRLFAFSIITTGQGGQILKGLGIGGWGLGQRQPFLP